MNLKNIFKKRLVRKTFDLLNRHSIPFWLDSSTLHRVMLFIDQKPIPPAKHFIISVPGSFRDKVLSLKNEFSPIFNLSVLPDRSGRKWIENEIPRCVIMSRFIRKSTAFKVVIVFKYKIEDRYRWVNNRTCKWVDSHYYDNLSKIKLFNTSYQVPSEIEEYLALRNPNWRNQSPNWINSIDDGFIVADKVINNIQSQKVIKYLPTEKIKLHDGNYFLRMKEMLLFTIDILEENKIKYWLEAGTLLGILRDGDLIPWDYDADLGIHAESIEDVMKLKAKFLPKYIARKRFVNTNWYPGDVRVIKVKTPWEKLRQINFHIDLFCVYPSENHYRWIDTSALKQVDKKYFKNLDTIEWEGRQINIPSHAEEYLTIRYGNWKIPDKNYDAGLHDGSIAERGF